MADERDNKRKRVGASALRIRQQTEHVNTPGGDAGVNIG